MAEFEHKPQERLRRVLELSVTSYELRLSSAVMFQRLGPYRLGREATGSCPVEARK